MVARTADIRRVKRGIGGGALDRRHQSLRGAGFAQVIEHHAALQKVASGFAMPLPAISNAEPYIGSNIDGKRRSGLRLAVGASPIEPVSAAARSDKMSACRLVATMVSRLAGLQHHAGRHRVDQHLVARYVGIFGAT